MNSSTKNNPHIGAAQRNHNLTLRGCASSCQNNISNASLGALMLLLLAGCAFDVVHVKQPPVTFSSASNSLSFQLVKQVKARLGTAFPTVLKANTTWSQVGVTEFGNVYATKDQVVKVEASNIYEAQIVVAHSSLAGFYLPIERTFSPLQRILLR